ncbi:MAG: ATP synthase F1 subunit delta [Muribaculaceae bacterium]|nr:ATP synthase F1 subunit delta [Muribaculaceae bacterium]
MNEGLIPRRYAKALYEVASQRGQAESLYGLMRTLAASAQAEPELTRTLANPYIPDADKRRLLATAAGASAEDTTFADWLRVIAQNHRSAMAPDIARSYVDYYRSERRIYPVTVTGATKLSADESKRMQALIQQHIGKDASMEYSERIDPDLIGGFTIDIANERLDASVQQRLEQMRLHLLDA